jgi:hypothetical protein
LAPLECWDADALCALVLVGGAALAPELDVDPDDDELDVPDDPPDPDAVLGDELLRVLEEEVGVDVLPAVELVRGVE